MNNDGRKMEARGGQDTTIKKRDAPTNEICADLSRFSPSAKRESQGRKKER